jgi:hypothetical protein
MTPLRQFASQLRPGRALYLAYYAPRAFARKCAREGALNLWLAARGRRAMERAARRLTPVPCGSSPDTPAVYFLSGRTFWYQTAFCAHSLLRHAGGPLRVVVLDDGSLSPPVADALRTVLPGVELVPAAEIEERLDRALPADRFPTLRRRRLEYPHLRKLTDVHAGSTGWKLVLDSDMLFFRTPTVMTDWLAVPDRPFHLTDVENAYGYSAGLLAELAGQPVPDRVNVGACGLKSDEIDWDRLEHWCRATLDREGSSYYQEQALTALLVAGQAARVAPPEDYVVLPTRAQAREPSEVLHHYVAASKAWYFRDAWRRAVPTPPASGRP